MQQALAVAAGVVATTRFNERRIAENVDAGFVDATALAEYLVTKGVAFRQAHQIVGALVTKAPAAGKKLADLAPETLKEACDKIAKDVYGHLGAANVVKRYAPDGAGSNKQLRNQLAFWKKELA